MAKQNCSRDNLTGDEHRQAMADVCSLASRIRGLGESLPYPAVIRSLGMAASHLQLAAEELDRLHTEEVRQDRLAGQRRRGKG